jgi:hypothetical protein
MIIWFLVKKTFEDSYRKKYEIDLFRWSSAQNVTHFICDNIILIERIEKRNHNYYYLTNVLYYIFVMKRFNILMLEWYGKILHNLRCLSYAPILLVQNSCM